MNLAIILADIKGSIEELCLSLAPMDSEMGK